MKQFYIILFGFTFSSLVFSQVSVSQKLDTSAINTFIKNLSNQDKFSGAVLIANDQKILFRKAYGTSCRIPVQYNNVNTRFNIASVGKTFTAVAVAQLCEKGRISYEEKIRKYLPELPKHIFENITISQLLTHQSGLGDFFDHPHFLEMKDTAKSISSYMKLVVDDTLSFKPGEKFKYSNSGFIVLGALIEKVAHCNYFDYIRKNIFIPAGMVNSGYYETDHILKNVAVGCVFEAPQSPGAMKKLPNTAMIEVKGTSAGGAYSSINDMHLFSLALLHGKLISSKSFNILTTKKVLLPKPPAPPGMKELPDLGYGFGFEEYYANNIRIIGHNGGAPGIEALLIILPEFKYTIVVLCNLDRSMRPIQEFLEELITKKIQEKKIKMVI